MIESTLALTVLDVFEPYLAIIWNEIQFRTEVKEDTTLRDTVQTLCEAAQGDSRPTLRDLRVGLATASGPEDQEGEQKWLDIPSPKRAKRSSRVAAAVAAAAAAAAGTSPAHGSPTKGKRGRAASTSNMICSIEKKVCPCGTETTAPRVTCAYLTAEDPFTLPLQQLSAYHLSFRAVPPPPLVLNSVFFDAAMVALAEAFLVSGSIFEVLQWCLLCEPDSFASLNNRLERDYASVSGTGTASSSSSPAAATLLPNSARAQHCQQLVKIFNLFPKDVLATVAQQQQEKKKHLEDDCPQTSPQYKAKQEAFFTFSQWFIRTVALRCFTEFALPLFLSDKKKGHHRERNGKGVSTSPQRQGEGRALLFTDIEPNVRTRPVFQRAAIRGGGDPTAALFHTECRVTVQWPADFCVAVKKEKVEDGEDEGGVARRLTLEDLRNSRVSTSSPFPPPTPLPNDASSASTAGNGAMHTIESYGPLLFTPYSVDELDVVSSCVNKFFSFAEHNIHPKRRTSEKGGKPSTTAYRMTIPQVRLFREVRRQQRAEDRLTAETTPKQLLPTHITSPQVKKEPRHSLPASPAWVPLSQTQVENRDDDDSDADEKDDTLSVCWLPYHRADGKKEGHQETADEEEEAETTPLPADSDEMRFEDIIDPTCVQLARQSGSSEALREVGEVLAIADKVFSGRIAISDRSWGYGRNRVPALSCSTILLNRSEAEMQENSENSEPSSQLPTAGATTSWAEKGELGTSLDGMEESRTQSTQSLDTSSQTQVLGLYHHESGVFYNMQMNAYAMDVTAKERW